MLRIGSLSNDQIILLGALFDSTLQANSIASFLVVFIKIEFKVDSLRSNLFLQSYKIYVNKKLICFCYLQGMSIDLTKENALPCLLATEQA